ncbi:hypothetical protein [Halorientalis persicus]|uniref:hypothetical protein n=1 Tax=Halorientalis persicus TaxID=1367881 RepID=UPI001FCD0456|nr:hypothetical protein [Halorientalis persicus]
MSDPDERVRRFGQFRFRYVLDSNVARAVEDRGAHIPFRASRHLAVTQASVRRRRPSRHGRDD